MITMTEAELRTFAISVAQIAFAAGVIGGVAWTLVRDLISAVADAVCSWEERRIRIDQARMRQQHGPFLLPGLSRIGRAMARRVYRMRASTQADQARASEREGGLHAGQH